MSEFSQFMNHRRDASCINSLILHDSPRMLELALRMQEMLEQQKKMFVLSTRRFDLASIHDPRTAGIAAAEAKMAELVIVAISPSTGLDPACQNWLWNCAKERVSRCGLLVLVQGDHADPPTWDFLRAIAFISAMDFLWIPETNEGRAASKETSSKYELRIRL